MVAGNAADEAVLVYEWRDEGPGNILDASEAAAHLLGRPAEALRGMALGDLVADRDHLPDQLQPLHDHGEGQGAIVYRDPAGRPIPVQESRLLIGTPTGTSVVAVLHPATALPITVGPPEAMLAAIVESSDDAIIGKTLDGIIVSWNRAAERIFGYSVEEACGQSIAMLLPPGRRDELARLLERLRRGERIDHFETTRRRKDGVLIHVSLTISPIRDHQGRVVGASTIARDITARRRAEETLRRREYQLRFTLDAAEVGTWEWDIRTGRVSWSANLRKIHGNWLGSFDGTIEGFVSTIYEPDRPRVQAAIRAALERGEDFHAEYRTFDEHGRRRWFAGRGRVQYDTLGKPSRMVGICMDATDRKETEERLRSQTMLLRSQSEASVEGILVVYDSGLQRIVSWNRRFMELWGFTPQDMAARDDDALLELAAGRVAEPDQFLQRVRWYYEHQEEEGRDEVRLRDGRVFDRYTAPVRDEDGAIYGRGWFFRDITEDKRMQQALRESEARFRGIFNQAAVGIAQVDVDGRFTVVNRKLCDMLGYTEQEMSRRSWRDVTHPGDQPMEEQLMRRLLTGETDSYEVEKRYVARDGSERWGHLTLSLVRDASGEPAYGIAIIEDIAQRKAIERALAQEHALVEQRAEQLRVLALELSRAEQRERRRLAQALHDHHQQLLVAAKLQLGRLWQRQAEAATAAAEDGDQVEPLRRLSELLDQAIESSRTTTQELSPPVLYDIGLVPAIEWLARQMKTLHRLDVHVDADEDLRHGDPAPEEVRAFAFSAVRELLFNVIKHADTDHAHVKVHALNGSRLDLRVEDEGKGFDPSATLGNLQRGTEHFGLFSIQERLRLLGGDLEVDSAPGEGTRVRLVVPMKVHTQADSSTPTAVSAAEDIEAARDAGRRGQVRVLIADDHQILREGLVRLLQYDPDIDVVAEASDGEEAIDLTRRLRPDVVIMDVTMPRLNGIEATRRLTAEMPEVQVIGLSLHEEQDMANAMRDAGAVDYLTKGGQSHQLIAAIRRALRPRATSGWSI